LVRTDRLSAGIRPERRRKHRSRGLQHHGVLLDRLTIVQFQKTMHMNISKIKIVAAGSLTAAFFIAGTLCASAATLNVAASQPSVLLNQPFRVDLQLNTQGDDMNAI